MTATHDPRREVEKLREHLASHDKPIAFLIGAGGSCAVRDSDGEPVVPAVAALGKLCEEAVAALGDDEGRIYQAAGSQIEAEEARGARDPPTSRRSFQLSGSLSPR
jgi:hypothetical protein